MTTHRVVECVHCGIDYTYQASGWGCHDKYNDKKYCPKCKKAIVDALEKIPVKFEYRYIPTDDFTKQEMLDLIKEKNKEFERKQEESKKFGGLGFPLKRVYPLLYNTETGESSNEESIEHNGVEYHMSWWESRPEEYSIRKKVKWDIENDCECEGIYVNNLK